jgi:hypothetical protein
MKLVEAKNAMTEELPVEANPLKGLSLPGVIEGFTTKEKKNARAILRIACPIGTRKGSMGVRGQDYTYVRLSRLFPFNKD